MHALEVLCNEPWCLQLRSVNMFKWNEKRQWCLIYFVCNTVRKIAAAEASWLTLSSTLLFAELPDLRRSVRGSSNSWSPKFAYLVLRNARRPNVTSPDYLPNLLGSLDRDGNADSNRSGGKKVPVTYCSRSFRWKSGLCFTELIVTFFHISIHIACRCYYTSSEVNLRQIQLNGYDLERHTHLKKMCNSW